MSMLSAQKLLAILFLLALSFPVCGQENIRITHTAFFRFDKTDIDIAYADNRNVLNCLGTLLSDSFHVSFIDSIHLYTYASPEGREKYNVQLSVRRADTMQRYLADNYPLLSSVPVSLFPQGENWDGLRALVSADTAFNEREEVLMILDKVHNPARRESLLKFLNGGKAFRYMQQHILPLLRNAMICIVWIKGCLNSTALSVSLCRMKTVGEMIETAGSVSNYLPAPTPYIYVLPKTSDRYSALKTNLAAWAIASVNLAYEIQIGHRFSLDLPLVWSSWDLTRTSALRIVLFQPELRYWFSKPGRGHFLGPHIHIARYNLKWKEYRYQDTGYPLWGVGFRYGYTVSLTALWGVEFNLGMGYANSRYKTFLNMPNGALCTIRPLRYWGVTNLGLSFIYKLSKP